MIYRTPRWVSAMLLALLAVRAPAQTRAPEQGSIVPLYRALRTVKLNLQKTYRVREAVLDRDDLHLFLNDGTLVFTEAVEGRITGMYFEGEGEILVRPPNRTEKLSLGLFTKQGVLADKFRQAYFRFNDDVVGELQPYLRPPEETDVSQMTQFASAAERLADIDALRLLTTLTSGTATNEKGEALVSDHFLHALVGGSSFGNYDVFYDSRNPEQIAVAQLGHAGDQSFYDLWMSFAARKVREGKADGIPPLRSADAVHVKQFKIATNIQPPNRLSADAELQVEVRQGGPRVLFFELSHELKLKSVTLDAKPVEWLQNEAIEGTQLARRGNDFVAIVLPAACRAGEKFQLHMQYEGSVLSDAGGGLLYVGAHGTWYPNRGLTPSDYELSFSYPQTWTLAATGKKVSETQNGGMTTSTWVTERPVPVAGFNLGRYIEAKANAENVEISAYATRTMEKQFNTETAVAVQKRRHSWTGPSLEEVTVPLRIDPSTTTKAIARDAGSTIDFYSKMLGPFPFTSLKLTQFPGPESQGWPGLIYLSSYAFLTHDERQRIGMNEFVDSFFGTLVLRHEVAHMWWGHEVFWDTYRDQWLSEALANYSALLMTEREDPAKFRLLMDGYRAQLLSKYEERDLFEAGPVTLGIRLNSSKYPDAYQAVAYGRGTWLIHMLRCMLQDGDRGAQAKTESAEAFVQVLRTILQRHHNAGFNNDDLRRAIEEVLPPSLRFEGRKSLDWFFDGWVNGTAIPTLEVSGAKFAKQANGSVVTGAIRQKFAPDDLVTSVPVYIQSGETYDYLGRVFAVGEETRFRLPSRKTSGKVVLDPFHTVLTR